MRQPINFLFCCATGAMLLAMSCSDEATSPASPVPGVAQHRFFNLNAFVNQQDSLLVGVPLAKTVDINGAGRTIDLESVNWLEELAPFAQSDIDRPALWDQYSADTTALGDGALRLEYRALDTSLFTRYVRVEVDAVGEVQELLIDNAFNSFLADTQQKLRWRRGEYAVMSRQEAMFGDPRDLRIVGEWDPKGR